MKTKHIIGLLVIGACIAILIVVLGNSPSYATFKMAEDNPGADFHVVGLWEKDSTMQYDPKHDPNYFSFYMKDSLGAVRKVLYHKEKPENFEQADKVVIVGQAGKGEFVADQILMKCPSKYNNKEVKTKQGNSAGI